MIRQGNFFVVFVSFESPCPGTAGFNVKYYKI